MIGARDGTLTLDEGVVLSETWTIGTFGRSPIARRAIEILCNDPWHVWRTTARSPDRVELSVELVFYDDLLVQVKLALIRAPEHGLALRRAHDSWLRSVLGPPPYEYEWGTVESVYDPRSDRADVLVIWHAAWPYLKVDEDPA